MKKIITVILAAILLVSCLVFSVGATGDGVIKVGRVSANAGETINVPVTYVNNPGLYIIRVTVSYDERAVEYIDIDKSSSDSFIYTVNTKKVGEILVLMDGKSMSNVTGDLELFSLQFKVKSDAEAGRALFPVYCEEGMATGLKKENNTLNPAPLSPATSSGSVTVLCDEHTFDLEMSDGSVQCSKCGAIKNNDGEVSVDADAGLPEIDVSASSTPSESVPDPSVPKLGEETDEDDKGGLKAGHFVPIIAAVIIAVLIPVIVAIFKKKEKERE